jgi:hypothetical protein
MKAKLFISVFCLCAFLQIQAQNHVGTWRLVSGTYNSSDGTTITQTSADKKEIKIITPTHFMWMSQVPDSIDNKRMVFEAAGGGHYTMNGNQYVELLEYASWEDYINDKTIFNLQITGDKMRQTGEIISQDGTIVKLDETWERIKLPPQSGKHVGTWMLTSQVVTNPKGEKTTTDMAKLRQVKTISPTHWMLIAENTETVKKKLVNAIGGSYTLKGNKYVESLESYEDVKTNYTLRVKGDKLYMVGTLVNEDGEKFVYDEVYQRDDNTAQKVARTVK